MKNQLKIFLILFTGIVLTTSCSKNEPPGPITTQTRSLDAFSELQVRGSFEVEITQNDNYDIEITAPENVLPYIETQVIDNRLILDENYNRIRETPIYIRVSNTYLKGLELSGSGSLSGATLTSASGTIELSGSGNIVLPVDCNSLNINLSGSGNITIYGTSPRVNYDLSGSGSINARSIDSQTANTNLRGSGNIRLFVSDTLSADLSGSGNIFYRGNPDFVTTQVTGSGNIIHF